MQLEKDANGKPLRVAQLRAVGSNPSSSLPTVMLALSKRHLQEARLDTYAQYSITGSGLRRYGRCLARKGPVDLVEGFGGVRAHVLGVLLFRGTTRYQQTVVVNALLVEGRREKLPARADLGKWILW